MRCGEWGFFVTDPKIKLSGCPVRGSKWYSITTMTKVLRGSKVIRAIDLADIRRADSPDELEQIKCSAVLLLPTSRKQS